MTRYEYSVWSGYWTCTSQVPSSDAKAGEVGVAVGAGEAPLAGGLPPRFPRGAEVATAVGAGSGAAVGGAATGGTVAVGSGTGVAVGIGGVWAQAPPPAKAAPSVKIAAKAKV